NDFNQNNNYEHPIGSVKNELTATREALTAVPEPVSQRFDFHLPLLRGDKRERQMVERNPSNCGIEHKTDFDQRIMVCGGTTPNPQKVHELTVINFHGIYNLLLFSLALSSLKYPKIFLHKQFCTAAEPEPEAPLRRLVRSHPAFSSSISTV
ncbi:hypothetical protein H5410_019092, partial [Solanum commersonii]